MGIFAPEPEPYEFLTYDQTVKEVSTSRQDFFRYEHFIELSEKQLVMSRTFYSFFQLISDIGGFNGAIIILPAFLMGIYSSKMYEAELTKEVPVRDSSEGKNQ